MSTPRIVLITGTSSGIGLSTALAFARNGDQVYATMRNLNKASPLLEQARKTGLTLEVLALDVENTASIQAVVEQIITQHGRIDVLINNAGAGYLGTTEQTSMEDVRHVFEVNFFGTWQVTKAVIPHMRAAGSGHIISVSSIGGLVGQPFNDAYCAAKFAVEGMMESLAPVLQRFGVHVSLVEPGAVNTEFVANVGVTFGLPMGTTDPYSPMLTSYLSGTEAAYAGAQTGDDVAAVLVAVAADAAPHLRYQTSDSIRQLTGLKYVDPTGDSVVQLTGSRLPQSG
jgi:NAD(P)-dependent dehydrogenase (short-subunit alcohol dehydrogenase family)